MNNKNEDRGMMKWAPFYSVLSEKEINDGVDKNNVDAKPDLSEDQIMELENNIIYAYNNKSLIVLTIFNNGKFVKKQGTITKLDAIHKAIYLNKQIIQFNNITKIDFF